MAKKYLYMQHAPIFPQKPFDESFASSKKQSWAWKYFRREKDNIEIKFGVCNVTDKS
ncbi:2109_t:CDS:2, partial [Dentiscutata heterogama]